jgi:SAM-dependent methyltransferase
MSQSAADPIYQRIGTGYANRRRVEPLWKQLVEQELGTATRIVNVGAGTGSYEPHDRDVVAVEPSMVMISQRAADAAPVVRAVAEQLPFAYNQFDVALALFTVHHWSDFARGMSELQRVSRRQLVVTWRPEVTTGEFWLARDYLPQVQEREANLPTAQHVIDALGDGAREVVLPIPADCADGVFAAYWSRPEMYLDPSVRNAMSGVRLLPQDIVDDAMQRLASDLADGTWQDRYGAAQDLSATPDFGYRLIVSAS